MPSVVIIPFQHYLSCYGSDFGVRFIENKSLCINCPLKFSFQHFFLVTEVISSPVLAVFHQKIGLFCSNFFINISVHSFSNQFIVCENQFLHRSSSEFLQPVLGPGDSSLDSRRPDLACSDPLMQAICKLTNFDFPWAIDKSVLCFKSEYKSSWLQWQYKYWKSLSGIHYSNAQNILQKDKNCHFTVWKPNKNSFGIQTS